MRLEWTQEHARILELEIDRVRAEILANDQAHWRSEVVADVLGQIYYTLTKMRRAVSK